MNRPKDCPSCNTWADNEALRAEVATLTRAVDTDYEQLYREANDQIAALTKEKNDWYRYHGHVADELVISQARFKELSAVLEGVELPFNLHEKIRYLLRESA
jgi:hypothetical protein